MTTAAATTTTTNNRCYFNPDTDGGFEPHVPTTNGKQKLKQRQRHKGQVSTAEPVWKQQQTYTFHTPPPPEFPATNIGDLVCIFVGCCNTLSRASSSVVVELGFQLLHFRDLARSLHHVRFFDVLPPVGYAQVESRDNEKNKRTRRRSSNDGVTVVVVAVVWSPSSRLDDTSVSVNVEAVPGTYSARMAKMPASVTTLRMSAPLKPSVTGGGRECEAVPAAWVQRIALRTPQP
jgi:hypothetical protein